MVALTLLALVFSAAAEENDATTILPGTWAVDPDGLRTRFVALFDGDRRALLQELTEYALTPERHGRDDFLRYMALVEALAADADARLFFLVEKIPDALDGQRREREERREAILNELSFRVWLLLEGATGDNVGDGSPSRYEFRRDETRSRLFLDRTPDPNNNTWTILYTAFRVAPGETAGAAVHDAGDRYGRYPGASFMRVKEGRILFTTPRPSFEEFFAAPERTPEYARDGHFLYPLGASADDEAGLAGPEMIVLFESLADDCARVRASLFQTNRDAYVPAAIYPPQCVLLYEWDGERYRLADRMCPDGKNPDS